MNVDGEHSSSSPHRATIDEEPILSQSVNSRGHKQCAMLFRRYVSRTAAGSGWAVLEGVGLTHKTIEMCYKNSPQNEEEAIQSGLMKWMNGSGVSTTWAVLLEAMDYAQIGTQHIEAMKKDLLKDLPRKRHRLSSTSSDDLDLQLSGAKKSLHDYTATKMDLLAQDMSDLRSESDPEVIIKLLYGNALATISDLLKPHLKEVKKAAVRYHRLGLHHVAVGKDIIESADSIDNLMSRMSVNSMWDNTRFLRRAIACIPQSSSGREVAEGILFHYKQHLAIYERATLLRDAQTKESESKEKVEASTEANKLVQLKITSPKAFGGFSCGDCYILQARGLKKAYGIPEEKIICRDVKERLTFKGEAPMTPRRLHGKHHGLSGDSGYGGSSTASTDLGYRGSSTAFTDLGYRGSSTASTGSGYRGLSTATTDLGYRGMSSGRGSTQSQGLSGDTFTSPEYSTDSCYGGSSTATATSTHSNSHLVEYQKVAEEPHTEEHSLSQTSLSSVDDEEDATNQWSKVPSEPVGGESDPPEEQEPATVKERRRSAPMMQMQSVPRIRRSPSDPSLLPEYRKYHEDPTEYADTVSPEIKAVEATLERLCYMATSIKELRVFPSGAGHKLVSVVVYLNMDGAILLKPVLLHLSHWCVKEEGEDQDTLKFATAPHILPSGQQYYDFEEQEEASFTTHTNVGILKISEPQCLHCVEAEGQKSALYRALTFSQRPSEGVLFFRIQLMCNSLDWIKSLTTALQRTGWEKSSCDDIVSGTLFEYSGKVPIEASLVEPEGYNWTATVEGNSKVEFKDFFLPKCKCTSEIEEAIQSGRSPPSIDYKVVYTIPQKQQVKPAVLKVALRGKDLELLFSCPIMQCSQTTAFTVDAERGTDSAQNTAPAVNGGKHTTIVSQTVSDRPDHLMLFRTFVSRNAATKGRAVLEGVWLDSSAIEACFNNADSEEAAVQAGLVKWKDGHSRRPPTWEVLLTAMDYAKVAQQHIQDLRKELALDWES